VEESKAEPLMARAACRWARATVLSKNSSGQPTTVAGKNGKRTDDGRSAEPVSFVDGTAACTLGCELDVTNLLLLSFRDFSYGYFGSRADEANAPCGLLNADPPVPGSPHSMRSAPPVCSAREDSGWMAAAIASSSDKALPFAHSSANASRPSAKLAASNARVWMCATYD
jgi:hypothetical protein